MACPSCGTQRHEECAAEFGCGLGCARRLPRTFGGVFTNFTGFTATANAGGQVTIQGGTGGATGAGGQVTIQGGMGIVATPRREDVFDTEAWDGGQDRGPFAAPPTTRDTNLAGAGGLPQGQTQRWFQGRQGARGMDADANLQQPFGGPATPAQAERAREDFGGRADPGAMDAHNETF